MTVIPIITAVFDTIVLALTPAQRWSAARRFNTSFSTELLFILIAVAALIILTVAILIITHYQKTRQRDFTRRLFAEYSEKRGLSGRERQILLAIARYAGLKRNESIFTLGAAFDRGAAKMVEESFTYQGDELSAQLRTELSFLREKLGFMKETRSSIGVAAKAKKLSSRQIAVGKKLHITRRGARDLEGIESTVTKNDDMSLTVELTLPLEGSPDELWRARYYFGASVWEFDISVISFEDNTLVLNHSDNIRFINRRSFLRVPVKNPAFVARFPFERTIIKNNDSSRENSEAEQDSANASGSTWGPPEFVPAVVTEMGGPGLRIDTPLEINAGERVLVVFGLEDEKDRDSTDEPNTGTTVLKIIQDVGIVEEIGEVKRTEDGQNGLSIAVELVGLNDSDVDELIRVTNAISLRSGARDAEESTVVQGV